MNALAAAHTTHTTRTARTAIVVTIAAVLAALAAGCACPTYTFEGNWTADEEGAVVDGFAQWSDAMAAQGLDPNLPAVKVVRMDGACSSDPDLSSTSSMFGLTTSTGAFDRKDATIQIWPDCIAAHAAHISADMTPAKLLTTVAAHEMGHALGLPHYTGNEDSIMKASAKYDAAAVQALDVRNLRAR